VGRPWARGGRGWVGYFVEVLWGLVRKEDLGCGRGENNAMRCRGEVEREKAQEKKGLTRTKGGRDG